MGENRPACDHHIVENKFQNSTCRRDFRVYAEHITTISREEDYERTKVFWILQLNIKFTTKIEVRFRVMVFIFYFFELCIV